MAAYDGLSSLVQGQELVRTAWHGALPVHFAAMGCRLALVKQCVAQQYDRCDTDEFGASLAHFAAWSGDCTVLNYALGTLHQPWSRRDAAGLHVLHYAALGGHISTIQHVMFYAIAAEEKIPRKATGDLGAANKRLKPSQLADITFLRKAGESGNTAAIDLCLHMFGPASSVDLLQLAESAASSGSVAALEHCVKLAGGWRKLIRADGAAPEGRTLMHAAALGGVTFALRYCLAKYAEFAPNLVRFSFESSADAFREGRRPTSVAACAALSWNVDTLKWCVNYGDSHFGATTNGCDRGGWSLAHFAAMAGSIDNLRFCAERFVVAGSWPGVTRDGGMTPVLCAARSGHLAALRCALSLNFGATDDVTSFNETVTCVAVQSGVPSIVQFCLGNHAAGGGYGGVWDVNDGGENVLEVALRGDNAEVAMMCRAFAEDDEDTEEGG
jgi:ankyrin repeat protein